MKAEVPSASAVRSACLLLLFLLLAAETCAGIIYWAWHSSLIGVALSALLPGSCAAAIVLSGLWRPQPDNEVCGDRLVRGAPRHRP